MIKKELYQTENEDEFTLSISEVTKRLILKAPTIIAFEKEEVFHLIDVLKDFYERMD